MNLTTKRRIGITLVIFMVFFILGSSVQYALSNDIDFDEPPQQPVEEKIQAEVETTEKAENNNIQEEAETTTSDVVMPATKNAVVPTETNSIVTATGLNLYRGQTLDSTNHIGTYSTWAQVTTAIKSSGVGVYSIDLTMTNLTLGNWANDLNSSGGAETTFNAQNYLNFYSSTNNTLTFNSGARMGAHVQFKAGLILNTPTSSGSGPSMLIGGGASGHGDAIVEANGWKFIVDKGITINGFANLYAGVYSGSADYYTSGRTSLTIDGNEIRAGYLEVNAGKWRNISAAAGGTTYGAYYIKVGIDDDPLKPVQVDTVSGQIVSSSMYPVTPDPDIATEYLEVAGNTIVKYGVAIANSGSFGYVLHPSTTKIQTTHKVIIRDNVSIIGTLHGIQVGSTSDLDLRLSVCGDSAGQGYGHYTATNIVQNIVEISGNVYIAGDVMGNGANMYYNVNSESKGTHIRIKDQAQIGGNIIYGGSSSASTVVPTNDSADNPFFSIEVRGSVPNAVKIGGSIIATNGEDNSNNSSWSTATKVENAIVNGTVTGYGNLGNESINLGIRIKTATIQVKNSTVGGGVYGISVGSGSSTGSTQNVNITVDNSTVGHVAPLLAWLSSGSGYSVGTSNVSVTNSTVTGRTVRWMGSGANTGVYQAATYTFVGEGGGNYGVKPMATVSATPGGTRSISFITDGIQGIPLPASVPDISLTASLGRTSFENFTISLAKAAGFPGNHTFVVRDSNFTRENNNPTVVIMDSGDGTLGTSALVSIDNCYATASNKKMDIAVFGNLTGQVTTSKVESLQIDISNSNDFANVGFVNTASGGNFINTKAAITLKNTVTDSVFGKKDTTEALRNVKSDINRVQFQFSGYNTVGSVLANGADIVFNANSKTYVSGKFNNTGASVFDKEWVDVKIGSKVFLGNSGAAADKDQYGGAASERIFGSIQGSDGVVNVYKDTSNLTTKPNATYPIYVGTGGSILSDGMNLGEWTGAITTNDGNTNFDATSGKNKAFDFSIPVTSDNNMPLIQKNEDILMVFGTTANAKANLINDVPLRPWPLVNHSINSGWLVLSKPGYQITYDGTGTLQGTEQKVFGKINGQDKVIKPGSNTYQFTENDPYTIENIVPTATAPGYRFVYWKLYSAKEAEVNGVVIRNNWQTSTEVISDTTPSGSDLDYINVPTDGKAWVSGNNIDLFNFLSAGKLPKGESKMFILEPVYVPLVCKIGSTGYVSLEEAFNAINSGTATAEPDGEYRIEMLIEEYKMHESAGTLSIGEKNITITTAASNAVQLPYQGTAGSKAKLKRSSSVDDANPFKPAYFAANGAGTLTLDNIILDGTIADINGPVADAFVEVKASGARLKVQNAAELTNNNKASEASAIKATSGTVEIADGKIYNNTAYNGGGAVVLQTGSNIEVKGAAYVWNNILNTGDQSNVKLSADMLINVTETLTATSKIGVRVDISNHVPGYNFAKATTEAIAEASFERFADDYTDELSIISNTNEKDKIQFAGEKHLTFLKVKAEDTTQPLDDASFVLYELVCTNSAHDHSVTTDMVTADSITAGCWVENSRAVSTDGGLVDLGVMYPSTTQKEYQLVETKTAPGYQLPEGEWRIIVGTDGEISQIVAHTPEGGKKPPAFIKDGEAYKLPNTKEFTLPLSGKNGITIFLIIGGIMMLMAFAINKRKQGREDIE